MGTREGGEKSVKGRVHEERHGNGEKGEWE